MIQTNIHIIKSIINAITFYTTHRVLSIIFVIISVLSGSLINVEVLADDYVVVKSIKNAEILQQGISSQNTNPKIGNSINATNATGTKTSVVNIKDSNETIAENIVTKPEITPDTNINAIESNISSTALNPNNQQIQLIQSNQPTRLIQQEQQKQQKQKEFNKIAVEDDLDATTNKINDTSSANSVNSINNSNSINHINTTNNEKNTTSLEEVKKPSKDKENMKKHDTKKSARKSSVHKSNNIHGKEQKEKQEKQDKQSKRKEEKDTREGNEIDLTNSNHDTSIDTDNSTDTKTNQDNSSYAFTLKDVTDEQQPTDISNFSDFPIKQPINGISFADNEQIKIVLSNRDINRISIIGDKIQSINGPIGFYTAKNDLYGSAYLGINTNATFTLFASTVKGHQISLLITPRHTTGKTIILNPTSPPLRSSTHVEIMDSYQKLIITFISGMINNEVLPNYSYLPAKKPKSYDLYKMMTIKPLGYYMDSNLVGVVSEIRNKTNQTITMKPSNFYDQREIKAIALSEETLAPKASGLMYKIYSR